MQISDQNDVSTALGLLRDSLAEEEQRIRNEVAKAMQEGDYDTATSVIEFAIDSKLGKTPYVLSLKALADELRRQLAA